MNLGNTWKIFRNGYMKKPGLYRYVYDISVDYDVIEEKTCQCLELLTGYDAFDEEAQYCLNIYIY